MRRTRWTALLVGLLLLTLLLPAAGAAQPPAPWSHLSPPQTAPDDPLVQVLHDGEQFVAISTHGMMLTSVDGITWSTTPMNLDHPVAAAAFADGRLVVLTQARGDGTEFKQWNSFYVFARGKLVGKTDGPTGVWLHSLWHSNQRFVALGEQVYTREAYSYTSSDGLAWREGTTAWSDTPMVVGQQGSTTYGYANLKVFRQPRGGDWQLMGSIPREREPARVTGVAYGNGRFVAIGTTESGGFWIGSSADGERWTAPDLPGVVLNALLFAGGNFLAVGDNLYAVSRDGQSWARQETGVTNLRSLVHHKGQVVAVGDAGLMVTGRLGDLLRNAGRKPVVVVPTMTGSQCVGFSDMLATDPACPAVATLIHLNAVSGYPDLTFRPGEKVTRAAFAKMLVLTLERKPAPSAPVSFSDVDGHWAVRQGYIQAAVEMGAMGGFPDGTFRPDDPVTRAQMVKAVIAAAGLRAGQAAPFYEDVGATWYEPFVNQALAGWLLGPSARQKVFTERQFLGDQPATRAETALLLANLFD